MPGACVPFGGGVARGLSLWLAHFQGPGAPPGQTRRRRGRKPVLLVPSVLHRTLARSAGPRLTGASNALREPLTRIALGAVAAIVFSNLAKSHGRRGRRERKSRHRAKTSTKLIKWPTSAPTA